MCVCVCECVCVCMCVNVSVCVCMAVQAGTGAEDELFPPPYGPNKGHGVPHGYQQTSLYVHLSRSLSDALYVPLHPSRSLWGLSY